MKYFKRGCLRGFGFAITVSLLLGLAKVHKWWDGKKYFWSSFWYIIRALAIRRKGNDAHQ